MSINEMARKTAKEHFPEWLQNVLRFLNRKKLVLFTRRKFSFTNPPENPPKSAYPFPISKDNYLEEVGAKYQPSKRLHNYLAFYWMHFRDIRLAVKKVVEIGVQTDRSILMWEEFFPNAIIYGIDIDPNCKQFEGGRRKVLIGDQSDPEFCRQLIEETGGEIDIIIDDGSHRVEHQLKTFSLLFPAMTDHGIYVVEDVGGCVGDPELVTVNSLKSLVDSIMYWPKGYAPEDWPKLAEFPDEARWIDKNVIGVAFYRWIVFVMRGKNPQDNPYLTKS